MKLSLSVVPGFSSLNLMIFTNPQYKTIDIITHAEPNRIQLFKHNILRNSHLVGLTILIRDSLEIDK